MAIFLTMIDRLIILAKAFQLSIPYVWHYLQSLRYVEGQQFPKDPGKANHTAEFKREVLLGKFLWSLKCECGWEKKV